MRTDRWQLHQNICQRLSEEEGRGRRRGFNLETDRERAGKWGRDGERMEERREEMGGDPEGSV